MANFNSEKPWVLVIDGSYLKIQAEMVEKQLEEQQMDRRTKYKFSHVMFFTMLQLALKIQFAKKIVILGNHGAQPSAEFARIANRLNLDVTYHEMKEKSGRDVTSPPLEPRYVTINVEKGVDVHLTVKLMDLAYGRGGQVASNIVFLCGDSDFVEAVRACRRPEAECECFVIGSEYSLSQELREFHYVDRLTDEYTYLDRLIAESCDVV